MKFKEFSKWCDDRASDGCWGIQEAIICCNICKTIYKLPFWKREKIWKTLYKNFVTKDIVLPINKKIQEIRSSYE